MLWDVVIRCQHLMWTCQHFRSSFNIFSESFSSTIQNHSTYGHDREDKDRRKFLFCKFRFGRFSSFCRSLTRFLRSPDGRISRSGFSFRKFWISFNCRSRFSTFSILLRLIGFGPLTDRILSGLNRGASKNENWIQETFMVCLSIRILGELVDQSDESAGQLRGENKRKI